LGVKGPKSKIEEKQFCRVSHGELTAKKWLDSIDKQKRRSNLKERDKRTDRQTARRGDERSINSSRDHSTSWRMY